MHKGGAVWVELGQDAGLFDMQGVHSSIHRFSLHFVNNFNELCLLFSSSSNVK